MKAGSFGLRLSQTRWLFTLCGVAFVAFLALKITYALLPIERWSIPQLASQLKARPSFADHWKDALRGLTPTRMERVRDLLAPTDYASLRRQAAIEIARRGSSASNAVSVLLLAIGCEDNLVAAHAEFTALGSIGPAARPALPELLRWLTNPDPVPGFWSGTGIWKQGAAWALVRIAPDSPEVAAALVSALGSCGNERMRPFLTPIEFTDPNDIRDLPYSYGRGWPSSRRAIIRAIGKLRPQTPETTAALLYELRGSDYFAQVTAADMLGEVGPSYPEIVAALKDALLRTQSEHLPQWPDLLALTPPFLDKWHGANLRTNPAPEVAMIYGSVPTDAADRMETIYPRIGEFPGWGLRLHLIRSLGRIGQLAGDAAPLILQECESKTNLWRFDAAVALLRVTGKSPEAVATFEDGLHAADAESREIAIARLKEIGTEFPKATTLLVGALRDPTLHIRLKALDSLACLGSNAGSSLPAIEALTRDRSFLVRNAATQAVEAIRASPFAAAKQ